MRPSLALLGVLSALLPHLALGAEPHLTRTVMVEETRRLADALEASHPDPYRHGGGKLAFHRRLATLLASLPEAGLTPEAFYERLLPFVAALGDSHTAVLREGGASPLAVSPEMPLRFRVLERGIFVAATRERPELIGAELRGIEGTSLAALLARQATLRGVESDVHGLVLMSFGAASRSWLGLLLPDWRDTTRIRYALRLASGEEREVVLPLTASGPAPRPAATRLVLPDTEHVDFAYAFTDASRRTALLRIDGMEGYREALEAASQRGWTGVDGWARDAYRRFHGAEPPSGLAAVIAGVPSATEVFRALVDAMAQAKTETLVVDVRRNTGGNGLMKDILVYFLYGEAGLRALDDGYAIAKLSPLFFANYPADTLAARNTGRAVPLGPNDYDFAEADAYRRGEREPLWQVRRRELATMPSFEAVYRSGRYATPRHRLGRVFVVSSGMTYSSGFNLLAALVDRGATCVGSTSAQAANNFGDSLRLDLARSGITAFVSYKRIVGYPKAPDDPHLLEPTLPLTLARWKARGFDPNAAVLLALEASGARP